MTQTFNTEFGRGFGPSSPVLLADGSRKAISSLRLSDIVWSPSGPSDIRAIITCGSYQVAQSMCWINGVAVTPLHPCRSGSAWGQAIHFAEATECYMPKVYNLVLYSGHSVDIGGMEFVTLAHGLPIYDSYFGSERVIADLKKQPGWEEGFPVYENVKVMRNPVTGGIDRWIESVGIEHVEIVDDVPKKVEALAAHLNESYLPK